MGTSAQKTNKALSLNSLRDDMRDMLAVFGHGILWRVFPQNARIRVSDGRRGRNIGTSRQTITILLSKNAGTSDRKSPCHALLCIARCRHVSVYYHPE